MSDVDQDVLYGVPFTEIVHADVRDIIFELYENGVFQAKKSYDNSGGKQYTLYKPLSVINTPVVNTPVSQPLPATNIALTKIENYLKNNGPSTIKQIQSRLKVKGLTCNDIAKLLGAGRTLSLGTVVSKIVVQP